MKGSVNNQLEALYQNHWGAFIENGKKIYEPIPTNPMLICVNEEEYNNSDVKVMICGKKTWGWVPFNTTIADTLHAYRNFFLERNFYGGYGKSAFWKTFQYFEDKLPKALNKKCTFIYQNVNKVGREDGNPQSNTTENIRNLELHHFPVFKKELIILNPDIILFLTGPGGDNDIKLHFPDLKKTSVKNCPNIKQKAWLLSLDLPEISMRLYNPRHFEAWTDVYRQDVVSLIADEMNK